MEYKLKTISTSGIDGALSKAQLYRYLNEPEESESICQDILAADPENQAAKRLLGLAITDQFRGVPADRYPEAEATFKALSDPYKREYYLGILCERRAKAQSRRSALACLGSAIRRSHEAFRGGRDHQAQRQRRGRASLEPMRPFAADDSPKDRRGVG